MFDRGPDGTGKLVSDKPRLRLVGRKDPAVAAFPSRQREIRVPSEVPLLHLRLLGRFEIQLAGSSSRAIEIPAQKHRAVLAYLAMRPDYAETRERLAALLWGDRTDAQARQSLRQCLLELKRGLGTLGERALIVEAQSIALDPRRVSVDARQLLHLAETEGADFVADLAALPSGPFLEGLQVDDEGFEQWTRIVRADIDLTIASLVRRLEQAHAGCEGSLAVKAAEQLVALNPVREDSQRLLLTILAHHRGREAALVRADALVAMLRSKLDAEPETETRDLIASIRRVQRLPRPAENLKRLVRAIPPEEGPESLSSSPRPSIVVLPFANMSRDPEQEYFADGITDDIITALSRLRWLFLIARNSSFTYKGRAVDVRQVARELHVRYVLEGSVRAAGERIRITGQLSDAETGRHIWSEKYDRQMDDIFAVQDEIAQNVVASIEPHLYAEEGFRAASRPPGSVDVWGLVVRSIELMNRFSRRHNEEARQLLRRAIEIDPRYARAHATLSWVIWWATLYYWIPNRADGYPRATEHAKHALSLDPSEPWARMTFGLSLSTAGQHERAISELWTGLKFNPSFALGRMAYGWALLRAGRFDEAIAETGKAIEMSPMDTFAGQYTAIHGLALLGARRFSDALPHLRASVASDAEFSGHYNTLISCCGHLGLLDEAQEVIARRNKVGPPLNVRVLRENLSKFAHCDVFVEGILKAGVVE
jgi:adenylate cyclase